MKRRSRRLVKKLHRRWLDYGVIDASQASVWRVRLLDAPPGQVFEISRANLDGLPWQVALAIHRYRLRYSVAVVDESEAPDRMRGDGWAVFKFSATDFPSVSAVSANNPRAR
jgi:hypothetical protein